MKYILKLTRLLTNVMYKSITVAGKFNGAKNQQVIAPKLES